MVPSQPSSLLVSVSPSHELVVASEAKLLSSVNPKGAVQWLGPDGSVRAESAEVHLNPVAQQDGGTWKCTFTFADATHTEAVELTVKGDL